MKKTKKSDGEDRELAIGIPQVSNTSHIKKRSLKNKALAISFNEKELKDYVTGFHKRKKKRRKEAQHNIMEKDRLKRIEKRKQRKQDREYVQGVKSAPANGVEPGSDIDKDEETELQPPVDDTRKYDAGNLTIMVTVSKISHEDEDKQSTHTIPRSSGETAKKHVTPVIKKKQLKTTPRRRSVSKTQKKREKRKGKTKRAS